MPLVRRLIMPDGEEYIFSGDHYRGFCNSPGGQERKYVQIYGADNLCPSQNMIITVRFSEAQLYNGSPLLYFNIDGPWPIVIIDTAGNVVYAGIGEWQAGEYLDLLFNGSAWVIIGRSHANTSSYGVTKLSNTISNDQTTALTPKAVYDAGFITLNDLPIYDGSVSGGVSDS